MVGVRLPAVQPPGGVVVPEGGRGPGPELLRVDTGQDHRGGRDQDAQDQLVGSQLKVVFC